MRKSKGLLLVSICLVAALAVSMVACSQPTPAAPITWRYVFDAVPGSPMESIFHRGLATRLEQATNGRLKVVQMEAVVPGSEALGGLKNRLYEMASWTPPAYGASYPWVNIAFAPLLWSGISQKDKVSNETGWFNFINDFTQKNFNTIAVAMGYSSPQIFYAKKPLSTLAAFKDLKVRTTGYFQPLVMQAIGAKPVPVAWGELYMAMQTGVADAAITGNVGLGINLDKVTTDVTYWPNWTMIGEYVLTIGKDAWDKLPADLKPIVSDTIKKAAADELVAAEADWAKFPDLLKARGMKYNVVTDAAELKKVEPSYVQTVNVWVKEMADKGFAFPPGMVKYMQGLGISVK